MLELLKRVLCCFVIIVFAITPTANGAKILAYFMTPSYSHQIVYQPVWRELSLRGHQVTVYTPNPLNDPTLTNLTEIDLSFSYDVWEKNHLTTLGAGGAPLQESLKKILDGYLELSEIQLSHPLVQQLIHNNTEKYDLFLVEYIFPTVYPLKNILNVPMVGISSLGLTARAYDAIGAPKHPILDPDFCLPDADPTSFIGRVKMVGFYYLFKYAGEFSLVPKIQKVIKKYFGDKAKSLSEIYNVSLILVNSNWALQPVRPLVPALVEISGMHIRPPKPLPKDLEKFLNDSPEGVIYFSLGSNVKSNLLPQDRLETIIETLAELPYKVLWKFENNNLPNKPKNVEIRKWLPQQGILGHKNVKLFITQAGLQSLDETIHNKKPILCIPFFGDQGLNCNKMVKKGAGLSLDIQTFTKEELKTKIMTVINDPSFQNSINRLNAIVKDEPLPALEKAVWWIEYVLRHDGAPHLRYGVLDMPTYQYYMLDVFAFFAAVLAIIFYVITKLICAVVKFVKSLVRVGKRKPHKD